MMSIMSQTQRTLARAASTWPEREGLLFQFTFPKAKLHHFFRPLPLRPEALDRSKHRSQLRQSTRRQIHPEYPRVIIPEDHAPALFIAHHKKLPQMPPELLERRFALQ